MIENPISSTSLFNQCSTLNYTQAAMMGLTGSSLQDSQQLGYSSHGNIPNIILTGSDTTSPSGSLLPLLYLCLTFLKLWNTRTMKYYLGSTSPQTVWVVAAKPITRCIKSKNTCGDWLRAIHQSSSGTNLNKCKITAWFKKKWKYLIRN